MTERDLKTLKDLPVPAARAEAKRAALDAAMAAFDTGANNGEAPQGSRAPERPISAPHPAVRRKFMQFTRSQYAVAASVAALMIAAPMAFQTMRETGLAPKSPDLSAEKLVEGPGKKAPASSTTAQPSAGLDKTTSLDDGKQGARQDLDGSLARPAVPPAEPQIAAIPPPPPRVEENAKEAAKSAEPQTRAAKDERAAAGGETNAPANKPDSGAAGPVPAPAAIAPAAPAPVPTDGLGVVGGYPTDRAIGRSLLQKRNEGLNNTAFLDPYAYMHEADRQPAIAEQEYRDRFESREINPVKQVAAEPVSTFSIDVDTASYSFVRRALNSGQLPPKDAVRVEEMINYFPYDYQKPDMADTPFQPAVTVMPSPWNSANQLVHVAIKGYELASAERPRANLVFLMDVSGSMQGPDRLELVKNAFRMLVEELKPDDTVAIVTYASGSGIMLEPTKISDKSKIIAAIDRLGAGGSTAGAQGIQDAYRLAETNFDKSAVNRVILATDGDFNVGVTSQDELKGLIERKRERGIFLSILGVGQGNYNDALMQTLAQNGNGTAAYADTLNEARKVLVDEASSTLFTIAKDVKVQIEWNPNRVAEYRLVGYETRALKREDFNNDRVDAGDIGSGHTVTAIYEITPKGSGGELLSDLRYGKPDATRGQPATMSTNDAEIGFLKLRYKLPKEDASKLTTLVINDALAKDNVSNAPAEVRFSVAVAAFGQLLKGAPYMKGYSYDDVIVLAQSAKGDDRFGYRAEFLNLARLAKSARP
jgi:Ca-activated chloride channel family protein